MIQQTTVPITDRTRIFELMAVLITAVGKFVLMDWLNYRFFYVAAAIVFWSGYVIFKSKRLPGILSHWGFSKATFKQAFKVVIPFAVFAVISFFTVGAIRGSLTLTWHILPILISYPLWGVIQQFLVIGLVAGNLNDMKRVKVPKWIVIGITALLFAVVHFPSTWLMASTFVLALFYGYVYLKVKNLYVLGLFHGVLGALFYYTVLGEDPFARIFLSLF
ncbi:MAG: CPBP family intramembrane glutamic endopeptidase [Gilvibacter sp.]